MNHYTKVFILCICVVAVFSASTHKKNNEELTSVQVKFRDEQMSNKTESNFFGGLLGALVKMIKLEKTEKQPIVNVITSTDMSKNSTRDKRQAYGGGGGGYGGPQGGYGGPQGGYGGPQGGYGGPQGGPGGYGGPQGGPGGFPDFGYDYLAPNDFLYDYYDWVCTETDCQLCNILTSECCDPAVNVNCVLPDTCFNNPCLSGGTCITTQTHVGNPDFICACLPGFTGKYCQLTAPDYFLPPPPPPSYGGGGYGGPRPSYGGPQGGYGGPQGGYGGQQGGYGGPQGGYGGQQGGYGGPQGGYGGQQPGYGAPAPSYGGRPGPQPSYAPQPSYGGPAPQPSYGGPAPQPSYGGPAPSNGGGYQKPAPQQSYGPAPAPSSGGGYQKPSAQPSYGGPVARPLSAKTPGFEGFTCDCEGRGRCAEVATESGNEYFCICDNGKYGSTCLEGFPNPCEVKANLQAGYASADPRIPRNYFIECKIGLPYLRKCDETKRWSPKLQKCISIRRQ